MAKTGLGAVLAFSAGIALSGIRVKTIGGHRESVDSLDDTALDSAGFYESCPDDLAKVDSIPVETYADLKKTIPVGAVGMITITFPKQDGQSTNAVLTGSGYITDSTTPPLAAGQRLMTAFNIMFDGKTGPTFTPAT